MSLLTTIFIILSTWFVIIITSNGVLKPSTVITEQSPTESIMNHGSGS